MKPPWRSASTIKSILTIDWWQPSWKIAGKLLWSHSSRPKKAWLGPRPISLRSRHCPLRSKRLLWPLARSCRTSGTRKRFYPRLKRKALLRCLIDKVVIHRTVPDQVQTRIVWRGGATTTLQIPVTVGALTDLSNLAEMEQIIIDLSREGQSDEDIAAHLTQLGYRSPRNPKAVLPSTVQTIRLQLRIFKRPNQSKSRLISGYLTIPQLAKVLDLPLYWFYDRIRKGPNPNREKPGDGLILIPRSFGHTGTVPVVQIRRLQEVAFLTGYQDDKSNDVLMARISDGTPHYKLSKP